MANSTKCLTPGTKFHTLIGGKTISIKVDLPFDPKISEEEAEILEILLHNQIEIALRPYFNKEDRS